MGDTKAGREKKGEQKRKQREREDIERQLNDEEGEEFDLEGDEDEPSKPHAVTEETESI